MEREGGMNQSVLSVIRPTLLFEAISSSSTWMMMMMMMMMMTMMSIVVMMMGMKFYIRCVNSIYQVQTFGSNRSLRVIDV
jgi:uncharacterized protein (DUF983 family)